ncbi:MAG: glycosyltransferase family 2 protein, partial [bacterium]
LWEPLIQLGDRLRLKQRQAYRNWLSLTDVVNLMHLTGFEVIRTGTRTLLPVWIPFVSHVINRVLAVLPGLRHLCVTTFVVARLSPTRRADTDSCSVIIPCRNEAGNIAGAVARTPVMGAWTELIFVDGNSTDGTVAAIEAEMRAHPERRISLIHQGAGAGKGDAVRKGFAAAKGNILMILDADLTAPPEDLPRFYAAVASRVGELVMGSRLVYPMEKQAMRFLNLIGNKVFSLLFTWLLDQPIKDTLCGTKVLWREDYERIAAGRGLFGDFDPFGDFDLIFGAARLHLKIVEIPIRYRERTYGTTNISRWRHGALLFRMCGVALRRLKLA